MASTTRTRNSSTWTRTLAALLATVGVASMGSAAFAQDSAQGQGQTQDANWRQNHSHGPQLDFGRDGRNGKFRMAAIGCGPNAADRLEDRFDRLSERLKLSADQEKLFDAFRTASLTAQTDFADACAAGRPGGEAPGMAQQAQPGTPGPMDPNGPAMGAPGDDQQNADAAPPSGAPVPDQQNADAAPPAGAPAAPQGKTIDPKAFQQGQGGDYAEGQPGDREGRPDRAGRPDRMMRGDMIQNLETRLAIDEARIEAVKKVLPELKAFYESLSPEQQRAFGPFDGLAFGRMPGRPG
jgi:hypothetical protein